MKSLITLTLLFQISIIASAQDTIKVNEVELTFSKGNHHGFSVNIPQAKLKDVISDWKKYIRQKNKGNISENKGEYVLSKTIIPDLSPDSLIIYSIITTNVDDFGLVAFITGNDSVFYSSLFNPELSLKIKNYIHNFAVNEYRNAVKNELSNEQKKLKQLEDNLDDLDHDNDKSGKKISANERENDRTQNEIKSNLNLQQLKSDAILQQQQLLATYQTPSDEKTSQEKKLKDLEKDKRKLEKQNESLHKNIEENESDNKLLQKKIDKNNADLIPARKTEIAKQKEKVLTVQYKLNGIK